MSILLTIYVHFDLKFNSRIYEGYFHVFPLDISICKTFDTQRGSFLVRGA